MAPDFIQISLTMRDLITTVYVDWPFFFSYKFVVKCILMKLPLLPVNLIIKTFESQTIWVQTIILFYFYFYFLRQSFALVTQAGVQWHDLSLLQPSPPGSK